MGRWSYSKGKPQGQYDDSHPHCARRERLASMAEVLGRRFDKAQQDDSSSRACPTLC